MPYAGGRCCRISQGKSECGPSRKGSCTNRAPSVFVPRVPRQPLLGQPHPVHRFLAYLLRGSSARPHPRRPWRVWDLDAELRYVPVVRALPESPLPVCEVGSGPAGLAAWVARDVIGVDPGPDARHGRARLPPNLTRLQGDGAHLPLADRSAGAAVAVDTMEHIAPTARRAVVDEMLRVTAPGGRVILMGPTGPDAAAGDRFVHTRLCSLGVGGEVIGWLEEHFENGLPTVEELKMLLSHERVERLTVRGYFNLRLWRVMHRAAMGDLPRPPREDLIHHLLWAPFAALARRLHRPPCYRCLVVAQLRAPTAR
jgi:SAM-dependent methyltransferase